MTAKILALTSALLIAAPALGAERAVGVHELLLRTAPNETTETLMLRGAYWQGEHGAGLRDLNCARVCEDVVGLREDAGGPSMDQVLRGRRLTRCERLEVTAKVRVIYRLYPTPPRSIREPGRVYGVPRPGEVRLLQVVSVRPVKGAC